MSTTSREQMMATAMTALSPEGEAVESVVGGSVGGVTDGVENVVLVVEEVTVTPTVVVRSEEKRSLNLYDMNRMCIFN